jgi:drug/metabolite transporter (DMT)-like permease
MIVGGAGLVASGVLLGELGLVQPENFTTDALVAFAYLVVFGSVLAYTAYTWLLQHTSVSRVATYAFVNPVVAIILGAVLLSEDVNVTMLVGAALIVVAVAVVVRTESREAPVAAGALEAKPAADAA